MLKTRDLVVLKIIEVIRFLCLLVSTFYCTVFHYYEYMFNVFFIKTPKIKKHFNIKYYERQIAI